MDVESRPQTGLRRISAVAKIAERFRRGSAVSQEIEQLDTNSGGRRSSALSTNRRNSSIASSLGDTQPKVSLPFRSANSTAEKAKEDSEVKQPSVPNKTLELFFALPNELQVQILCELNFNEVLTLRLTNASLHRLIQHNESPIVRRLIKHETCSRLIDLWPPPKPPEKTTVSYFSGLTHRDAVAQGLATHIADFIMIKICRRTTTSQQETFRAQHQRIRCRTHPLILTLYHFFESYRAILLHPTTTKAPNHTPSPSLNGPSYPNLSRAKLLETYAIESPMISTYDADHLLRAHGLYKLLLAAFVRKLRPPSYAGRFERTLRGWRKTPASQADIVKVLLLGGIPEVKRIFAIKTYAARRSALDEFIQGFKSPKDEKKSDNDINVEPSSAIPFTNAGPAGDPVKHFATPFGSRDEDPSNQIQIPPSTSFPELRHIWNNTAEWILWEKGILRDNHGSPTLRDFIEGLIREDDDVGGSNELREQEGVYDDTSDGEEGEEGEEMVGRDGRG